MTLFHQDLKGMTDIYENKSSTQKHPPSDTKVSSNWGRILFVSTLLVVLVFFWWLLIYSGGVVGHQG